MEYHLEYGFEAPIHVHLEQLKDVANKGKLVSELLEVQEQAIAMLHTHFLYESDAPLCWHVWLNDQAEEPIYVFIDANETKDTFVVNVTNPPKRKYKKATVKDMQVADFLETLQELFNKVK
ncbi:hypothetical protein [Bacillus thuringiensis]|uniref:hypothetical protein n=1 Tax=Bacillus thuringiensis TaxID=1428 RepID=UPI000BFE3028|nr:hypothetical protein [Bacillus thuringiensis]PGT89853.1 hypothetical protein COD17_08880 [Bacillus thuringiensis]